MREIEGTPRGGKIDGCCPDFIVCVCVCVCVCMGVCARENREHAARGKDRWVLPFFITVEPRVE